MRWAIGSGRAEHALNDAWRKRLIALALLASSSLNDQLAKSIGVRGRRFTVALRPETEGGYSVQCLELPAAISQGETKEEALTNIREAIELVLEHLKDRERGKRVQFVEVTV